MEAYKKFKRKLRKDFFEKPFLTHKQEDYFYNAIKEEKYEELVEIATNLMAEYPQLYKMQKLEVMCNLAIALKNLNRADEGAEILKEAAIIELGWSSKQNTVSMYVKYVIENKLENHYDSAIKLYREDKEQGNFYFAYEKYDYFLYNAALHYYKKDYENAKWFKEQALEILQNKESNNFFGKKFCDIKDEKEEIRDVIKDL